VSAVEIEGGLVTPPNGSILSVPITSGARVTGAGYHDVCFRWDISMPQPCVGRLASVPAIGSMTQPGRTLFASRDRFGKWDHFLGPRHVMVAYVVQPKGDEIRRLEVQAHLGPEGEDDLCRVDEFSPRYLDLTRRMALFGVLPSEEPRVVRVDVAVDVEYDNPQDGAAVLEALRFARWPGRWYAEWQGAPPYTTVALKSGRHTVARAYCRNSKLKNGCPRFAKIRFEREQRFDWATARLVEEFANEVTARLYWDSVFGLGRAAGAVTRLSREVEAVKLIERVVAGAISTSQYEQVLTFVTVERLGLVEKVYSLETARRRKVLARRLGISASSAAGEDLDVSLDELLSVPRAAWASR
jgi:hypothetical protein